VNARPVVRRAAYLLLALLLVGTGCHRYEHGVPPPVSPEAAPEGHASDNTVPASAPEWLPPAVALDGTGKEAGAAPVESPPPGATVIGTDTSAAPPSDAVPTEAAPPGASVQDTAASPAPKPVARPASPPPTPKVDSVSPPPNEVARPEPLPVSNKPKPVAAPHPAATEPAKVTRDAPHPGWAKSPEELVYRVDFIGITMGYARFRYQGKVSIDGKPAYHLNVRAWTSGILSYIYPINETIDYYLDVDTIAPIRQEFTQRESELDDVAFYNQETGKITYRYRQSGKIRKQVDTVPSVYDPVSVAYYFRWKDLGAVDRPRNMYGGRKIYQISSRILGNERIHTEHGDVDTIAVVPVIRRDGKPDDKGDLKIWFSNDERRVPVRLYAKFRKIKDWTLVGELMPPAGKAGG
jgi:hypothetical protein